MTKQADSKDDAPLRLFKSDFMEWFTHISPVLVLVVFLPIVGFFLWRSARANPVSYTHLTLPTNREV